MLEAGVPFWVTLLAVGFLGSVTGAVTLFTIWPSRKNDGDLLRRVARVRHVSRLVIEAKLSRTPGRGGGRRENHGGVHDSTSEAASDMPSSTQGPIVNRCVDPALHALLDLFVKDLFLAWFSKLVRDPQPVEALLRNDLHVLLRNLRIRLGKIDKVKFFTQDLMLKATQHFERIRIAQNVYAESKDKSKPAKIAVSSYLASAEKEIAFLRKACEVLLAVLLPESYANRALPRRILRDVIATTILYPLVNQICDPDYLNQKILAYISRHRDSLELHQTTFRYAASYEDFVKMIHECSSVNELRQLRHGIMTEIAQATTINNLKTSKSSAAFSVPDGAGRAEMVHVRNLARYLNQLMVAKNQCEQRLLVLARDLTLSVEEPEDGEMLGDAVESGDNKKPGDSRCAVSESSDAAANDDDSCSLRGDASLNRATLAETELTERDCTRAQILLLEDKLRSLKELRGGATCPRTTACLDREVRGLTRDVQQLQCFAARSALWTEHIGQWRACVQSADAVADACCPPGFAESSSPSPVGPVVDPVFLLLVQKEQVMLSPDGRAASFDFQQQQPLSSPSEPKRIAQCPAPLPAAAPEPLVPPTVAAESNDFLGDGWVVPRKLSEFHELKEKLAGIAEDVLKSSRELPLPPVVSSPGGKAPLGRVWDRTELDKAKAQVQTFLNVVLRNETLSHSQDVFSFLCPLPDHLVRLADAAAGPSRGSRGPGAGGLSDSNGGGLLSPGSLVKVKAKFSLATLFNRPGAEKDDSASPCASSSAAGTGGAGGGNGACGGGGKVSSSLSSGTGANLEDVSLLAGTSEQNYFPDAQGSRGGAAMNPALSAISANEKQEREREAQQQLMNNNRDSIAEPLYALVQEIFDVQGIFRWLRKTLITFVQITYGRTINRQIRETVSWLVSDTMLVAYCDAVREAYWPEGKLAPAGPPRSDEQKLRTRYEAKEKFLGSIPAVLSNLVGQQNGKRGAIRIFETMQDQRLNKQLLYSILETLLAQICPELGQV